MRALIQRVRSASVEVEGETVGAIQLGLLVFVGVGNSDTEQEASWLAHKTANLRIFPDSQGKMNFSVKDVQGSILVVSQFTLYGDIRRGFRPSFGLAAPPDRAEPLIQRFQEALAAEGVPIECGVFQAHMLVALINDGPVTVLIEKSPREKP